jgi:hypothetical protein
MAGGGQRHRPAGNLPAGRCHFRGITQKDALAGVIFPTVVREWGLELFVARGETEVYPVQLAVTHQQVKRWKLPTRDVKRTDSRAPKFIETYGPISVELDAIPPNQLRALVGSAIAKHADTEAIERLRMIEQQEREALVGLFRGGTE